MLSDWSSVVTVYTCRLLLPADLRSLSLSFEEWLKYFIRFIQIQFSEKILHCQADLAVQQS